MRNSKGTSGIALTCKCIAQLGKAIAAQARRSGRIAQRFAQMNGRLLRSALQDEGGPAQQRKIEDQAHPMFRDQGLDHIEQ